MPRKNTPIERKGSRSTRTDSRHKLLKNAARLISERGYAYVTLDEIVKKSGVTKGSLFWHFKNKRELYFECVAVTMEQAFALPDDHFTSSDPKIKLHQYLEWIVPAMSKNTVARRLLLHIVIDQDAELMSRIMDGPLGKSNETLFSLLKELKPGQDMIPLSFFVYSIFAMNDEFITYANVWAPNAGKVIGGEKTVPYLERLILNW